MSAIQGNLTIKNVSIFDGESEELFEGDIQIVDGTISEIGKNLSTSDQVMDAKGKFAIPGLIDNHFHAYGISLDMVAAETGPRSYAALKGAVRLKSALKRGFTTVRDVAGGDIGLRTALEEKLIMGPRYFFTGPALSQTGGHGDFRTAHMSDDVCCFDGLGTEVVDGVDNLRTAVRNRFRTGAHAIKIMSSGGVVSLTDPIRIPQYSSEEIRAVTDEATRRNSYVAAHAYSPEAIVHAVSNGVRSIEHGNLLDAKTAEFMAANKAVLVPTLVTYFSMSVEGIKMGMNEIMLSKNAEVLDNGKLAIDHARSAGVLIGFGSDLMGDFERYQLQGIRHQADVLTPVELLRSLTSNNAKILNHENLGRLKAGCVGDVLLLNSNPLEKPASLWEDVERVVIQSGNVVSTSL